MGRRTTTHMFEGNRLAMGTPPASALGVLVRQSGELLGLLVLITLVRVVGEFWAPPLQGLPVVP